MTCKPINIYLRACIPIEKSTLQGVQQPYKITGLEIAPEYIVRLFNSRRREVKDYTLTPVDGTILWEAPKEDFINSEMSYSIMPTVPTPENFIEIHGKITSK